MWRWTLGPAEESLRPSQSKHLKRKIKTNGSLRRASQGEPLSGKAEAGSCMPLMRHLTPPQANFSAEKLSLWTQVFWLRGKLREGKLGRWFVSSRIQGLRLWLWNGKPAGEPWCCRGFPLIPPSCPYCQKPRPRRRRGPISFALFPGPATPFQTAERRSATPLICSKSVVLLPSSCQSPGHPKPRLRRSEALRNRIPF
jgi:hypothetical protein